MNGVFILVYWLTQLKRSHSKTGVIAQWQTPYLTCAKWWGWSPALHRPFFFYRQGESGCRDLKDLLKYSPKRQSWPKSTELDSILTDKQESKFSRSCFQETWAGDNDCMGPWKAVAFPEWLEMSSAWFGGIHALFSSVFYSTGKL